MTVIEGIGRPLDFAIMSKNARLGDMPALTC